MDYDMLNELNPAYMNDVMNDKPAVVADSEFLAHTGFSTLTVNEVNVIMIALKEAIAAQTVDEVLATDNHFMGALVKLSTFKGMGTGSIGLEAL